MPAVHVCCDITSTQKLRSQAESISNKPKMAKIGGNMPCGAHFDTKSAAFVSISGRRSLASAGGRCQAQLCQSFKFLGTQGLWFIGYRALGLWV